MSFAVRSLSLATLFGLFSLGSVFGQPANPNPPADPNFRLPGQLPGQQRVADPNMAPAFMVPQGPANPYLTPVQPGFNGPMANLSSPYVGGMGSGSLVNPGASGYNPYYPNPYYPIYDPYGGALTGYANVINAAAQSYVIRQQARVVQQQAIQAQLDTRRKIFDQIRYERMSIPSPEEVRVHDMEVALGRSRRNPPLTEIWSGEALNSLLNYLIKQQGGGLRGPRVDLDEEILKHINVNPGTGGNVGLLRDGGVLRLPPPLQRPEYADDVKVLRKLLPAAVEQSQAGRGLEGAIQNDILTALQNMSTTLNKSINLASSDLTSSQYIESRRYLNYLSDALRALQTPDALKKWTARGRTVAELIKHMDENGLRFAPATPGDEGPYRALHNALNSYDTGILQLARP
jgi:hypothetical protein